MPLMTKIRESMTTVFAVFAGVFVVYIVLDWGMDLTSTRQATQASEAQMVGFVNGEGIPYRDFSNIVQQNVDGLRGQSTTEPDQRQIEMIRDQVWNSYVEDKLFQTEIDRLGIRVTDQEIIDAVKGDTPPDFLKAQFTDSTGTFNREMYESAISDPRNKAQLVQVEEMIRRQKLRDKLRSVVTAGVRVREGEIEKRYHDGNTEYTIEFALFEPPRLGLTLADSVPEADLRAYYDEHITEYKTAATRRLKYVQFLLTPSADDTAVVVEEMNDIVRRANSGADFAEMAQTFSEDPAVDEFFGHGELSMPPEIETQVYAAEPGAVVGPYLHTNGMHVVKILDKQKGTDEFIHAEHVLIQDPDSVAGLARAKSILARAKAGESIGDLAAAHSAEPGASTRRGDLGWFGRGRMVKEFEDAVYPAKVGSIVGPVRTQFGFHVVKVLGRDFSKVKLRDIRIPIEITARTQGQIRSRAEDFAYLAKEGDFANEASLSKYDVAETAPFEPENPIPGLGTIRAAMRFASEGEIGDVSDAISINNGFAVFTISEAREAGVRPLGEVRSLITQTVLKTIMVSRGMDFVEKRLENFSSGDSLNKLADGNPGISAMTTPAFKLGDPIPRLGRDPAVAGVLEALEPGATSRPIAGNRGVIIVRLLSRTPFDSTNYSIQRTTLMQELLASKKVSYFTSWSENLRESAEIVDNRDLFYR